MTLARTRTFFLPLLLVLLSNCDEAKFSKSGERTSPSTVSVVDFVNGQGTDDPIENPPNIDPPLIEEHACGSSAEGSKVWICHYPPGNPLNRHSVCVSVNALPAHVGRHGSEGQFDSIGACDLPEEGPEDIDDEHDHEGHCVPQN